MNPTKDVGEIMETKSWPDRQTNNAHTDEWGHFYSPPVYVGWQTYILYSLIQLYLFAFAPNSSSKPMNSFESKFDLAKKIQDQPQVIIWVFLGKSLQFL